MLARDAPGEREIGAYDVVVPRGDAGRVGHQILARSHVERGLVAEDHAQCNKGLRRDPVVAVSLAVEQPAEHPRPASAPGSPCGTAPRRRTSRRFRSICGGRSTAADPRHLVRDAPYARAHWIYCGTDAGAARASIDPSLRVYVRRRTDPPARAGYRERGTIGAQS